MQAGVSTDWRAHRIARMQEHRARVVGEKQPRASQLTEKPFRAQRAQHVRDGVVEQRHSHGVLHREPRRVALQRAVFERPHGVYPRLAGTVNETAVDPTGDTVYLRTRMVLYLL